MPLPNSGLISLGMVNEELGRGYNSPISLGDSDVRNLAGRPSGAISMSDLYGKGGASVPSEINDISYTYNYEGRFRLINRTSINGTLTMYFEYIDTIIPEQMNDENKKQKISGLYFDIWESNRATRTLNTFYAPKGMSLDDIQKIPYEDYKDMVINNHYPIDLNISTSIYIKEFSTSTPLWSIKGASASNIRIRNLSTENTVSKAGKSLGFVKRYIGAKSTLSTTPLNPSSINYLNSISIGSIITLLVLN